MAYRPQHCTLVVRNTDGSGYLRQFNTLAEAKVAYASISASGAAVSLYQPATRSLALFEDGGDAPEYDNGMTYGTGAVVKLNGRLYRLINFIGAGGYGPISHPYAWEDGRVPATGGPPPISSTNTQVIENGVARNPFDFTPVTNVTVVRITKTGCLIAQVQEADGNIQDVGLYPMYRYTTSDGTIVDEQLGEKDTNGCHYPLGFKVNFSSDGRRDEIYREVKVIKSLDYGGNMYGPYFEVDIFLGVGRWYDVSNGAGGVEQQESIGVPTIAGINVLNWEYQQDGDVPYRFTVDSVNNWRNWEKLGHPIPNGHYLVTYKVTGDEKIHSGYWSVSLQDRKSKWVFTPEEPDQPPPLPCTITRKRANPVTGVVEEDCDPDVVYPYTVTDNCEPPATVTINGTEIVVGTNIKTGMNNGYGYVTWGPCSGMIYTPNGTNIFDDSDYNYYSNGIGGFYSELKNPNPCPSAGSRISREVISDYTVTIGGSNYTVGYQYEDTIADGNCGSGIDITSEYSPSGTLIVQYDGNNYFSNGAGDYYSEPISIVGYEGAEEFLTNQFFSAVYRTRVRPQYEGGSVGEWSQWNYIAYGTLFGSSAEYNYYSDGAGSYYTEPVTPSCPSSGTQLSSDSGTYYANAGCGDVSVGSWSSTTYADGVCGSYSESGGGYESNGTYITNCNEYNYYSDGMGSLYQGEYTGTPCDPYGTQLSSDGGTQYVNVGCEDWAVGDVGSTTYADGTCGSYTDYFSNYVSNGTYLGNCNDYNYYANGSGGYYQGEFTGTYPTGPTGNTGSGTNYIEIDATNYENGSYSSTEYHDGNGGYYTEYSYSYQSYGYTFTSVVYGYDWNLMMNIYTYYNSDGNGGYYTSN